jgi:hypothetical protein
MQETKRLHPRSTTAVRSNCVITAFIAHLKEMNMKQIFLLLFIVACSATASWSQTPGKIDSLIKQTGYEFTKAADKLWVTKVEGKNAKEIALIVAESEGMTILFSVVAEKATLLTPVQMKQLLKLSLALDKVKIGLDEDDNLMVRIDLNTRLLDKEELTQSLDQLGGAADEVFTIVPRK